VQTLPAGGRDCSVRHLSGERFEDKFEVIECLGRGATSLVLRVRHRLLDREMAVKVLVGAGRRDRSARARFFREASVLATLAHSGIVRVHTLGEDDVIAYVVMDLIAGESLQEVMDKRRLTHEQIMDLGGRVACALSVAHEKGIVHRDVKPANIMLTGDPTNLRPVLIDFGSSTSLAKDAADESEQDTLEGTPVYMSPEQFSDAPVDARSDIYSLGCVLYELIAGQLPFRTGNFYKTAIAHAQQKPPALPASTPAWLAALVMSMLEKDPARRPQSMKVVAQAFSTRAWTQSRGEHLQKVLTLLDVQRTLLRIISSRG